MEYQETLETGTIISNFSYTIQDKVYDFFAHSVMSTIVVICCVLFTRYHLLMAEQLSVGAYSDLVNHSGLQFNEDTLIFIFLLLFTVQARSLPCEHLLSALTLQVSSSTS